MEIAAHEAESYQSCRRAATTGAPTTMSTSLFIRSGFCVLKGNGDDPSVLRPLEAAAAHPRVQPEVGPPAAGVVGLTRLVEGRSQSLTGGWRVLAQARTLGLA